MDIVKNVLDNAKLEKVIETAASSHSRRGVDRRAAQAERGFSSHRDAHDRRRRAERAARAMLENVASAYDAQVEARVQALTSLLEPIMMLVMGGGVGFIAFAILMPLIQMNDFVQQ